MTDNIGISLLITIIGCFIGLAGWLKSRDSKIANDAEWKGQVNAKLDGILGIRSDVDDIDKRVREHDKQITSARERADSAHKRIDTMEGKNK